MSVEKRGPMTVLLAMTSLRLVPDLTTSKMGVKGNFYSHSLTKARLGNLTVVNPF